MAPEQPVPFYKYKVNKDASKLIRATPLVKLNKVSRGCGATVVAKQEMFLPTASNKDRAAFFMIKDAETRGEIIPGETTIIEPTSGNFGISLAFVGALKGYKVVATMPKNSGIERGVAMKAFGAEVVLTDPAKGVRGAIKVAEKLHKSTPNSYMLKPFENPANTEAHIMTTGPEIWDATQGKVDIFVMGIGTGGTLAGVAKCLKQRNPAIRIYGVEPAESNVYNGGQPGPHGIIGIGAGMKSKLVPEGLMEKVIEVTTEDALTMARRLAHLEGLMVGIVSGANTVAALKLARMPENKGKLIVTIHSSYGERYLSTPLYKKLVEEIENMEPVPVEDDDKDKALTPAYKMLVEKIENMKPVPAEDPDEDQDNDEDEEDVKYAEDVKGEEDVKYAEDVKDDDDVKDEDDVERFVFTAF
ncbi:Cysteine synthase [Melia azedarach]|uniref:Cysteine synthase n=1 Tax=Melia azedarach TaxID=155640 RepID=A0ACC1WU49_MELAZ|nr:Cysteine synthase [Melia azedarach]